MRTRSMASQPEPGLSAHGTAAPAPPPASTHRTAAPAPPPAFASASTHWTAAPAPPPAPVSASTHGTAAIPAYRAIVQRCVALHDWWLVRGQDGKICVFWSTGKNRAARVFSSFIAMRHADGVLHTADHKIVLIRGPLNIEQMHRNGFPWQVSKQFRLGFPIEWEKYANSNMKQANEHTLSPAKSTDYYVEKFLRGSFANSMEHTLTEFDSRTSKQSTGNTDGPGLPNYVKPRIQEPSGNSGDYDNSMSNMAASEGLCIQTDASGQGIVTHSVNSALANNDKDKIEEERGPSKLGNSSVCPGTEHVLEVLNKGVSPEHGSVHCPRRLRSGKVYGMSNGASLKRRCSKRKTMQHETLSMKVILTEETAPLPVRLVTKRVAQLLKPLLWINFNHMIRVIKGADAEDLGRRRRGNIRHGVVKIGATFYVVLK